MTDETTPEVDAPSHDPRPSWWTSLLPRTPGQVAVGVLALMFLAGAVGFVLGSRDAETSSPSADSADVGFLYDMTAHHRQALLIAQLQLTNGSDPVAMRWARDILRAQAYEIGLMEMRLGTFGHDPGDAPATAMGWMGMPMSVDAMPGLATQDELDALRTASGAEADALFYALMIDHHVGGVAMADEAATRATDEWVAETAATMAAIQASEIAEMSVDRDDAGFPADPPGFTPDHMADAMTDHTHG
jgi:uncharacterized protein (DUF305 family)